MKITIIPEPIATFADEPLQCQKLKRYNARKIVITDKEIIINLYGEK